MEDVQEIELNKTLLAKWIARRDKLNLLIEALQRELHELGEEVTTTSAPQDLAQGSYSAPHTSVKTAGRPDEYFGMSQTDAAASYLRKVGHAVHLDQILEALQAGGVKFSGKNPKTILYTALIRGTKRFVLVSPGTFGLSEFYPNRKGAEKND